MRDSAQKKELVTSESFLAHTFVTPRMLKL